MTKLSVLDRARKWLRDTRDAFGFRIAGVYA